MGFFMESSKPIALISVSDKSGIVEFALGLVKQGWQITATGGTKVLLENAGVQVIAVEALTESPEILKGKVKTLHPKVFGSIMADRLDSYDLDDIVRFQLVDIRMVVVNFYPFTQKVEENPEMTIVDAHQYIDIGGPSMLRAAAKALGKCLPVVDPKDYPDVLQMIQTQAIFDIQKPSRLEFIRKAFAYTRDYDTAIESFFADKVLGSKQPAALASVADELELCELRYGENPHQAAKWYPERSKSCGRVLENHSTGKVLSYNNLLDLHFARRQAAMFERGYCSVVVKHNNPCGVGYDLCSAESSLDKALASDPQSSFGGVLAFNCPVNLEMALKLKPLFIECLSAPEVAPDALDVLSSKKNLRILVEPVESNGSNQDIRGIGDYGRLEQRQDALCFGYREEWRAVSDAHPATEQMDDLDFCFCVAARVKSNAIVIGKSFQTIGIGAGQMSRIDALKLAVMKAQQLGHSIEGAVLASDGFFPFRDCLELAAENGIAAFIQPGGSMRDADSLDAANKAGVVLVHTGSRHFSH